MHDRFGCRRSKSQPMQPSGIMSQADVPSPTHPVGLPRAGAESGQPVFRPSSVCMASQDTRVIVGAPALTYPGATHGDPDHYKPQNPVQPLHMLDMANTPRADLITGLTSVANVPGASHAPLTLSQVPSNETNAQAAAQPFTPVSPSHGRRRAFPRNHPLPRRPRS
jgi:hypothetical protein